MKIYLKKVAIALPDGEPLHGDVFDEILGAALSEKYYPYQASTVSEGVISVDHPDPDMRFGAQVDDWEDRADEETMKALK